MAQDELLQAFTLSEQMEMDGKEYYLKLSRESVNERGRALFQHLAEEEDLHRERFRQIVVMISKGQAVPPVGASHHTRDLRTIFSEAVDELEQSIQAPQTELDAVRVALDMERKSIGYYEVQARNARDANARRFYLALVAEEKMHEAALLEYCNYAADPDGWIVGKTKPAPGACFLPGATGSVSQAEW